MRANVVVARAGIVIRSAAAADEAIRDVLIPGAGIRVTRLTRRPKIIRLKQSKRHLWKLGWKP
jgi:hypothetical protein